MHNCKFCSRETVSKNGNSNHERLCKDNPNRVDHNWKNKTHTANAAKLCGMKNSMGQKVPNTILDVSSRTVRKILIRLGIGCSNCGWCKAGGDVHHIIPKSKGGKNDHTNLTYLCPNCHRLAHENKLTTFVSLAVQIGDKWKSAYYAHA